ncbi:MAG: phosphoglucosamine mutase, partial [Clostridia bacterium]|nr:phosphoglucosamine mutase [Clostridia bacterium]
LDYASTGDGQLTAIQLLQILRDSGKTLGELADEIEIYPQVMLNVRVSQIGKARYANDKEIGKAVESAEKELGANGRIIVRVSGTEPLIRVMVEGKNETQIKRIADEIASVVRNRLI